MLSRKETFYAKFVRDWLRLFCSTNEYLSGNKKLSLSYEQLNKGAWFIVFTRVGLSFCHYYARKL